MLTPAGRACVGGGAGLLLVGALLVNLPLIAAASLPLLLVAAAAALPREPRVTRTLSRPRVERGGRIEIAFDVELPRGFGLVEVHQKLPDEFELVEGNNLQVLPLRASAQRLHRAFVVRAPKRGVHELPPVSVRVIDPLMLSEEPARPVGEPATLEVLPRQLTTRLPEIRGRAARPPPDGDSARLGAPTDDFREIRGYVPGDPVRRINWKATARALASAHDAAPLVNETEREGRKKVWLVVDGHPRLSAGSSLENTREHAADAALALAEVYARRGFEVGLSLARSSDACMVLPASGQAQAQRLRAALARLSPSEGPSLVEVLERDARHQQRVPPLVVLVTRLAAHDPDLEQAVSRIGMMAGKRGSPGVVVDVQPPRTRATEAAEQVAQLALAHEQDGLRRRARATGLRVVTWEAGAEPFAAAWARGRVA